MMEVQKFAYEEMEKLKPEEDFQVATPPENDENISTTTDALTKLLQAAKLDVRKQLKRPSSQERLPFTHVNNY